ncbi:MAG: dihydrolipoamide acetyltransferase family protein [Burkholderiales bacterium]
MTQIVKVPDIGEGIAEVELVAWHVKPGDAVEAEQVLADVMTDKATIEVPSPVAGTIAAITGNPGDKLAVGSELLRIETTGQGAPAAMAEAAARPSPPVTAASEAREAAVTPIAKPLASPSVRQHARELGVDLAQVRGTGRDGRVVHEDVVRHAARAGAPPAAAQRYAEREGETAVPVIGLRRQIARHMEEALRIPHFTYVEEVDVTELETLRAKLNERFGESRGRLTVLPFLMRAIALAAHAFPQMNARFDEGNGVVTRYAAVNIGIATQTDAGLTVPVVRHAEARDLWGNAAEVARLADLARKGKASRDDLSGSTITVTSLGPLGGIVTTPVINAPEVAIVGVNRIVERPVVRSGAIQPRLLMNLSSSFDHRVIDGLDAAEFVQALRGYLECPALLFVE